MRTRRAKAPAKLPLRPQPPQGSVTEVLAWPKGLGVGLFCDVARLQGRVCLVAQALGAQLRGGRDDKRQRRASPWGHHFPISTQARGQPPS